MVAASKLRMVREEDSSVDEGNVFARNADALVNKFLVGDGNEDFKRALRNVVNGVIDRELVARERAKIEEEATPFVLSSLIKAELKAAHLPLLGSTVDEVRTKLAMVLENMDESPYEYFGFTD